MLKMLENSRFENDAHVWITILKNLNFMLKCVISQTYSEKLQMYLRYLLTDIKNKIGFEIKPNEGLIAFLTID